MFVTYTQRSQRTAGRVSGSKHNCIHVQLFWQTVNGKTVKSSNGVFRSARDLSSRIHFHRSQVNAIMPRFDSSGCSPSVRRLGALVVRGLGYQSSAALATKLEGHRHVHKAQASKNKPSVKSTGRLGTTLQLSQDKHCFGLHCHVCRHLQDLGVEGVEFLNCWAVSGRLLGFTWLGDMVS